MRGFRKYDDTKEWKKQTKKIWKRHKFTLPKDYSKDKYMKLVFRLERDIEYLETSTMCLRAIQNTEHRKPDPALDQKGYQQY